MALPQRCQGCGYDLAGSEEEAGELRCPECGRPYLAGEHPNPDWPGRWVIFIEGSGLYLLLLAIGVWLVLLPAGAGVGAAVLLTAAGMGLIGPVLVARSYAVRFPVREVRWLSRWRLLTIVAGVNLAAGSIAWLVVRMLR